MKDNNIHKIGVDVGSTTLKVIILDNENSVVHKVYRRHKADINNVFKEELNTIIEKFPNAKFTINVSGSAGIGISERTGIPFVQEVVASVEVVNKLYPETRTMIDLGGEDAKMVFFHEGKQPDIRMNGSCAGGTGAFIDQMADLMNISVSDLSGYADKYNKVYPVASRCGVFAKTDVQNLISRSVPIEDLAKSILDAVAMQTITSLARGYDILPKILFIGGPLTFIPALRQSFKEALEGNDNDYILPENSEFFPALGSALYDNNNEVYEDLRELTKYLENKVEEHKDTLEVLFKDEQEYENWKKTRKIKKLEVRKNKDQKDVHCFLGIDSGSTTTKVVIVDTDFNIVYSYYTNNEGSSVKKVIEGLNKFYDEAETDGINYKVLASASTGYGEELIKSALGLNYGIVETMAHLSGAQYVDPDVSFVLDIGGQDIKSIFTKNGVISNIELNEACSSGCGSFLQNFASTMNVDLSKFSELACTAKYPRDLGSRCTVFMNSKVKQSLRENAGIGDISAGLAYSVVKNCLFKVLKITNLNSLGNNIVVQGGTFRNDAVYRALELISGKSVSSTDHPELMGALGAALYAGKVWNKERREPGFKGRESLNKLENVETKEHICKGCTNNCQVVRFKFDNGNICYSGNKCEKVFFNKNTAPEKGYNAFDKKNEVLFNRDANSGKHNADNGHYKQPITIGIPRILNMFENYPFWHELFTQCGFNVKLSPESTFTLYRKGVGGVMSENICFPAKLAHGHILSLIEDKVDRIFYPIIPKEEKEFNDTTNSFNCPIVSGYPEVIQSSIDPQEKYGIPFDKPVITLNNGKATRKACFKYLSQFGISQQTFDSAYEKALKARDTTKQQLQLEQKTIFDEYVKKGEMVFVVAGRPYHADPLIHQKVGQIMSDLGGHVFTDDIFRHEESAGFKDLTLVSQWSYPNRVVQSAIEIAKLPQNVQLIQLNSFGCGPDSFFMDETRDILNNSGKNHTILRIDEIASPGSIRLRLRSLMESLKAMKLDNGDTYKHYKAYAIPYTKEDRRKTILFPWFSDSTSPFLPAVGELAGYKIVNLPKSSKDSAEVGLKYGNNEVCYPSTLVLGDIIYALQSGKYDLDNTVVAITQTGGQCRATNYISQIKNGLKSAGFPDIPVIVLSTGTVYQNDQKAFKLPVLKIINIVVYTVLYGDALQQMYNSIVVREKNAGDTKKVFDLYVERGNEAIKKNNHKMMLQFLEQAVVDFNNIPIIDKDYSKIGLIGEIFVKYNDYAQAYISDWLRSKGMEVDTPPVLDFLMQYFVNYEVNRENGLKRGSQIAHYFNPVMLQYMNKRISRIENIVKKFRFYQPAGTIFEKAGLASEIIDLSNQFGEGWSIAAEVAHYARCGVNKVVCIQPFGCIANHVVAKGIEKRIKKFYPNMNLLFLDIDSGVAEVNLQNRLHFML
ncbi:acyl-CoA dehydratase activase-related protein [Bacteroidales bacterium OttesenSCG-928-I21]|nr:acyl-CoA dehydratase activase-related protein [Bacteroidales bacterium OttesenSCG-928-I21]